MPLLLEECVFGLGLTRERSAERNETKPSVCGFKLLARQLAEQNTRAQSATRLNLVFVA
jgi:hypothetical protein